MNNTAAKIFTALDLAHTTTTATAAALGVSKQAYSVARKRLNLSDSLCIRACAVLHLDPAAALIALHLDAATTPETIEAWKNIKLLLLKGEDGSRHNAAHNTNYALNEADKSRPQTADVFEKNTGTDTLRNLDVMRGNINAHFLPLSKNLKAAMNLVKWMLCLPKFSPTSPRFKYYADNYHVLDKIERNIASGLFYDLTKDCPAFSSEELRAALDYINDSDTVKKPLHTTKQQSGTKAACI